MLLFLLISYSNRTIYRISFLQNKIQDYKYSGTLKHMAKDNEILKSHRERKIKKGTHTGKYG